MSTLKLFFSSAEPGQGVREVSRDVRLFSKSIDNLLKNEDIPDLIPLPAIDSEVIELLIQYINEHVKHAYSIEQAYEELPECVKQWDTKFFSAATINNALLVKMLFAADYMEMPHLLRRASMEFAERAKGKSTEEIRKAFNIKNDFSAEEEDAIRKENGWLNV